MANEKRQRRRLDYFAIRAFQLAADPTKSSGLPATLDRVPHLEFAALEDAVDRLKRSAKTYDDAIAKNASALSGPQLARLTALMLDIDQTLAPEVGLPGKNLVQESHLWRRSFHGYGAKTLPGVREAIEDRRWNDANRYANLTRAALNAYSDRLDSANSHPEGHRDPRRLKRGIFQ